MDTIDIKTGLLKTALFLKSDNTYFMSFLDKTQNAFIRNLYTTNKDLLKRLKTIIYNEIFANKDNNGNTK